MILASSSNIIICRWHLNLNEYEDIDINDIKSIIFQSLFYRWNNPNEFKLEIVTKNGCIFCGFTLLNLLKEYI